VWGRDLRLSLCAFSHGGSPSRAPFLMALRLARLTHVATRRAGGGRHLLSTPRPAAMATSSSSPPPWADLATCAETAPAALSTAAASIPPLTPGRYKGQAGRVAVVGGCAEYTGAPFFAAMAALRTGSDLAHVFCTPGAAAVIKGYGPDLIVHPYLPGGDAGAAGAPSPAAAASAAAIAAWLPRFDAVVIGPGLGKDPAVVEAAAGVAAAARAGGAGLVLDADGLALVCADPGLVRGYSPAILTPNAAEFGRLAAALGLGDGSPAGPPGDAGTDATVAAVVAALDGPALLLKGSTDRLASPGFTTSIAGRGSLRRAGGQGDVLAGAAAAFLAWSVAAGRRGGGGGGGGSGGGGGGGETHHQPVPAAVAAAAAGAALTRAAAARAFARHGRAMVAADVLGEVGPAFAELFEGGG